MKKSALCSTKPRSVSTGPPLSTVTSPARGGSWILSAFGITSSFTSRSGKLMCGGRLVDDDAHRAFGRMRAHVDQAARETLVLHARRRDQHLAVEEAARGAGAGALLQRFACHSHGERLLPSQQLVNKTCTRCVHEHVSGMCAAASFRASPCSQPSPCPFIADPGRGKPARRRIVCRNCRGCLGLGRGPAVGGAPDCRAAHDEQAGRVFRAGIEIKLKQGWKTYWRYPGDSGVPPAFDFSKSQNVKSVTVLYPAPIAVSRRRRRQFDRLQGRRDLAAACRAAGCRQAGDAEAQARLCGLRKALRARRRPSWSLLLTGDRAANEAALGARRGAGAEAVRIGDAGRLRSARSPRDRIGQAARRRRCPAPAGAPVDRCSSKGRRRNGRCPCRSRSPARRRACSASPSNSTACRPARSRTAPTLRLTAVAGDKAVEVAFRLD